MVIKPDTRTALLDFAEQAARARGFDGFSYADLAKAAGIRTASIHYHFPTKAILSAALMDRYHANFERLCEDISKQSETAGGRMLALIALYRAALSGGKTTCLCVSLTSSKDSLTDDVVGKVNAFRSMMVVWLTKVFTLAQGDLTISAVANAEQEARASLAVLEGAHLAARAEENVAIFDEALSVLSMRCAQ